MLRPSRQGNIRQRPTIHLTCIRRIRMTTRHQPKHEHSASPSDRWSHGMIQPGNWSIFCSNNLKTWNSLLPTLKFTYNSKPHATRKESPYFLQLGYNPIGIPTAYQKMNTPANKERLRWLSEAQKEAEAAHELHSLTNYDGMNHMRNQAIQEKVWLEWKHLKLQYETKKLVPKQEGPFKTEEFLSPLNHQLKLPKQGKIHPIFHTTLLSPYLESDIHRKNFLMPPTDLVNG